MGSAACIAVIIANAASPGFSTVQQARAILLRYEQESKKRGSYGGFACVRRHSGIARQRS